MENRKTFKEKLQNIIRQLPWIYDTPRTAIVSVIPAFNYQQVYEEVERFKRACDKEFLKVENIITKWVENKGLIVEFDLEYDDKTRMEECLAEIIEAFKKNDLVKEELSETTMTDANEMEVVKKLTIVDDYRFIIEDLIGLGVLEETIYSDIFDTIIGLKMKEEVLRQLIQGYIVINEFYSDISEVVKSIHRYREADIPLGPSDYVILDGNGEFVGDGNNKIVIYGDYVEAYNNIVNPQGEEQIVSCAELSEEKQEELIKFIKDVIK